MLFGTIYRSWSRLPPRPRPQLVATGVSLGAYGTDAAFSSVADITARTNGALFVGPPNDTQLWQELTSERAAGSPEWQPVWHGGRTVRFAASAGSLRLPDGTLAHPKIVYVQHADDPVVWWSPSLVLQEPGWLAGPHGSGVIPQMHWYPLVTFWQVTADLIVSTSVPPGHGHDYGPEIPAAWAALLDPPGWTTADTAALTALEAASSLP